MPVYGRDDDTWERLADVGLTFLIERARLEKVTTYTELNATLVRRTRITGFDFERADERAWRAEGPAGLASKGPGGSACRLDDQRLARLAQALEEGPAAHGFDEDQRWTLARVSDLIARLFHTRYTPGGVSYLLHRLGFSPQVPAHRAVERDENAILTWRREVWPAGKR